MFGLNVWLEVILNIQFCDKRATKHNTSRSFKGHPLKRRTLVRSKNSLNVSKLSSRTLNLKSTAGNFEELLIFFS